jgi:putative spermidine/putrescine transport system ATP-binding protein
VLLSPFGTIDPHVVEMAQPRIRFDHVSKRFGATCVVDDLTLDIAPGEFISLLGPSGSGKTTLLMLLAGFEAPSAGKIWLDGRRIDQLPPYRRDLGVVFQSYALFPHLTAAANVAFPLEMRSISRAEIAERVGRALDMVQLRHMSDRKPSQLSGGQQQRVALARALVFEPSVVLMDEPLGALDKQLREQMQLDIRALHQRLELTVAFVTHDQSEALTMSDRIAVFNHGRIEQIGSPSDIYDSPATRFVAEFIGETNLIEGVVQSSDDSRAAVLVESGATIFVAAAEGLRQGQHVLVSIRPERIELFSPGSTGVNHFSSRIVDCIYQGDHLRILLDDGAFRFNVRADRRRSDWAKTASIVASFSPSDCWVIAK